MGLISLPTMLNNKYDKSLASGIVCSSGTLGQIIPPSIVLIIIADQLASAADVANTIRQTDYKIVTGEFNMPGELRVGSTSAGDMFLGALLPGLVLVGLYMIYVLVYARLNPKAAPPVPFKGKFDSKFWTKGCYGYNSSTCINFCSAWIHINGNSYSKSSWFNWCDRCNYDGRLSSS